MTSRFKNVVDQQKDWQSNVDRFSDAQFEKPRAVAPLEKGCIDKMEELIIDPLKPMARNNAIIPLDDLTDDSIRQVLVNYGFVFIGIMQGQPGHKMVKLPPGWKRKVVRQGRDQIEFELIDAAGNHRVRVFIIKPSNQITLFEPEHEATYILSRFRIEIDEAALERYQAVAKFIDVDSGKTLFRTRSIEITKELGGSEEMLFWQEAKEKCRLMADERFPGREVPGMYWDVEF